MRKRDWVGLALVMLAVLLFCIGTAPANATALPPPEAPKVETVDRAPPLQPGDIIIRDPGSVKLRDQHPYSPLPTDLKERMKDPQAWA
jgi:hypothetical protein